MDGNLFPENLLPADSLRRCRDKLMHIRPRSGAFFRKIRGNKSLLLHKGKPLSIRAGDIDWGKYRKNESHPG